MNAQIIVADDDENIADLLGEYLSSRQHRVSVVYDGFQLAQKAAELRPHLIITDVLMPCAHDFSVYQVLQKDPRTQGIPILFISGHPLEQIKDIIPNDSKTRFLQKPLSFSVLEKCIQELLTLGGCAP